MHVNIKISYNQCGSRVFSRNVALGGGGGNCFRGERKCEKHEKTKQNLLLFGGEF